MSLTGNLRSQMEALTSRTTSQVRSILDDVDHTIREIDGRMEYLEDVQDTVPSLKGPSVERIGDLDAVRADLRSVRLTLQSVHKFLEGLE